MPFTSQVQRPSSISCLSMKRRGKAAISKRVLFAPRYINQHPPATQVVKLHHRKATSRKEKHVAIRCCRGAHLQHRQALGLNSRPNAVAVRGRARHQRALLLVQHPCTYVHPSAGCQDCSRLSKYFYRVLAYLTCEVSADALAAKAKHEGPQVLAAHHPLFSLVFHRHKHTLLPQCFWGAGEHQAAASY